MKKKIVIGILLVVMLGMTGCKVYEHATDSQVMKENQELIEKADKMPVEPDDKE